MPNPSQIGNLTIDLNPAVLAVADLLTEHFGTLSNFSSQWAEDAVSGEAYVEVSFDVQGEVMNGAEGLSCFHT